VAVSSGPTGGGASPDAPRAERDDASTQGTVRLTRGGLSCHLGGTSSSQDGPVLLLVGLAGLALARRRSGVQGRMTMIDRPAATLYDEIRRRTT
jgi:hypothetical protein